MRRPVIVHLDLDAFFSAVEQLHKPSLRGKPVVVGGTGRRGVVATASYEARAFGVGSAMPIGEARRRCPNAAYLAPRFAAYQAASRTVMGLLAEVSPLVEQVSVDEAYLDLTPTHPDVDVPAAIDLLEGLRARIREETGLTASVGAGTSKLVAKIGSELGKPDGLTVIAPGTEAETLAPMPIRRLPGVGPATQDRLHRHGLRTVGEVADHGLDRLVDLLGRAHGRALHEHARGIDARRLEPSRETKSVSAETTFPVDLTDPRELLDHARRLTDRVVERLAADGSSGRTITLKIRSHNFTTITRSTTLGQPTDAAATVLAGIRQLLSGIDTGDGVRLLGVGVSGLSDYTQQDLPLGLRPGPAEPASGGEGRTGEPASAAPAPSDAATPPAWRPGEDVVHTERGPGWVQGAGLGRVTVRFEGPHTPPGPVVTFPDDDAALSRCAAPVW